MVNHSSEMPGPQADEPSAGPRSDRASGLLAGMRIRKKLVVLHTSFSLVLAAILLLALRPALSEVVGQAESHEAQSLLALACAGVDGKVSGVEAARAAIADFEKRTGRRASFESGSADDFGLTTETSSLARDRPGRPVRTGLRRRGPAAVVFDPAADRFLALSIRSDAARNAVIRLYILLTVALLAVYALVAAALEVFVLPQNVYGPIGRMLEADRAVQEGRRDEELIPESAMPADELGEIMKSRNKAIHAVRRHERELNAALHKLEVVANDLKVKNHLIEMARRNLAETDRLASVGMMSAGLAHEMNTPLAVLKGLAEKLEAEPGSVTQSESELMVRVVGRLERLSEGLLDFARVRSPLLSPTAVRGLVDEAWTMVQLDRDCHARIENVIEAELVTPCDANGMVQVLVNVLRNSVDVMNESEPDHPDPAVVVAAERVERDGQQWVSVTITDNGPGIDSDVLPTLFEPFVSTRLDSRGTGLGLAVADGIVREHGGLLLARNRRDDVSGAVFEVMLPAEPGANGSVSERDGAST